MIISCAGTGLGESIILCPGGQHTLVCSTNHIFLEWSVRTTSQPMMHETRTVSSSDRSPFILPIRVNAANITFSRDSAHMTLPLVSIMTIENVNSYLEGAMINCTGLNSSSVSNVALMTTVCVFDINRGRFNVTCTCTCIMHACMHVYILSDCVYFFMALSMQMLPVLLRLS